MVLDKTGEILQTLTGLEPQYAVIIIGIFVALLPAIRKGKIDDRVEGFLNALDYSKIILSIAAVLSYYYTFGAGFGEELIGIVAGFILGTTVTSFFAKVSDF